MRGPGQKREGTGEHYHYCLYRLRPFELQVCLVMLCLKGRSMLFRTVQAQFPNNDPVTNANAAGRKIRDDLSGFSASLIIFFSAINYDPHTLAAAMHAAFPGAVTLGCTTAGEAVDDQMLEASVVAMAFTPEVFEYCETALVTAEIRNTGSDAAFASADAAMAHIGRKLAQGLLETDYHSYVGLMLGDRISFFTEALLERIGELTNVLFVGGFAGDDCLFENRQMVFYKGEAHQAAAVLALLKPRSGFSFLKTQAVGLTDRTLVITKADEYNRIIWKFNGEPAAQVYADLIRVPVASLDIRDFDQNPLAIIVDGEPFLRALVKVVDGAGLQMFASVKEGTRLTLTRSGDVLNTTALALQRKIAEEGTFSALLHINCAARHTSLKQWNQCRDFAGLFKNIPGIGFSSYGEIHVGIVAMTSTMILFK